MIIPITVKIINTCSGNRDLFGREYSFPFDINLSFYILKLYLISYLDLTTDKIEIINYNPNIPHDNMKNYYSIKDTMKHETYLDIVDNFENIFYLYFCK